ncbi:MAG: hypothetical protein ACUVXJ_15245 [Phycisphaerae bacterium]
MAICLAGCIGQWRPSNEYVSQPVQAQRTVRVESCLLANRLGRWLYERVELPERQDRPIRMHVRQVDRERLREGVLEDRPFLKIEKYLDLKRAVTTRTADEPPATQPPGHDSFTQRRPRAPLDGGTGIFFCLAQAADPMPLELESEKTIISETAVVYYNYRGVPQAKGRLYRCSVLEGIEDIECPAGRFEGCVRIRVDLRVYFPWLAIVDLTTYLWLSPEVGEVRRVQRLSGWFLVFPFVSADEYRLISFTPAAATTTRQAACPPAMWKTGAVLLEGDYPGIRIAGMVIDFEAPQPGQ